MLPEEIIEKIQILPVEKLVSHEEIIPFNLQRLREGMLNMGRLVDPIIVEDKHYMVIDGNHRKKVLEIIKCPNAACQIVDYQSPQIKVGTWFPVSKAIKPEEINGFLPEPVDFEEGMRAIERLEGVFLFARKKNGEKDCYLYKSEGRGKLHELIAEQRKFILATEGRDMQYVADDRHEEYLNQGYSVFYRRTYTKEEIISEALAGRLMPPKSTRHIVPDRIIRLNMHLGWLAEPPEVAKELMDASLKRRLGESSIRRYTESVIVLY
ncbi:MAG: hypothetical protein N3G22_02380 [Candidatus Micrarchaeota archaeon]|nr:hypothetical protein [Candidatus Micrarchaeota archaeon]